MQARCSMRRASKVAKFLKIKLKTLERQKPTINLVRISEIGLQKYFNEFLLVLKV